MVFATAGGESLSYGNFLERIAATAATFSERLAKGSRVACILGNTVDYLILRYALSCAGLVEIAVNGQHKGEVLRHMLEISRPNAVVVGDALRAHLEACGISLDGLWVCSEAELREIAAARRRWEARPAIALEPGDCCRILFTSGTGGRSKAVELSHAYEVFTGERHVDLIPLGVGDRWLYLTPLFHIDAIYILSVLLHTEQRWRWRRTFRSAVSGTTSGGRGQTISAMWDRSSPSCSRAMMHPKSIRSASASAAGRGRPTSGNSRTDLRSRSSNPMR